MVFCGQCGFQLAPGMTKCPRCGAAVEADMQAMGESHVDDPTVASQSFIARHPSQPPGAPVTPNQQKLVLPPTGPDGSAYDYGAQTTFNPVSRVEAQQNYPTHTPMPPTTPGTPYQGYMTQNAYPGYGAQSGGNYPPQGASYGGFAPQSGMGYQQQVPGQGQYQQDQAEAARRSRGRVTGLTLILIGILLILTAVVVFALKAGNVIASINDPIVAEVFRQLPNIL